MPVEGRGLSSNSATSGEGHGDWETYQLRKLFRNCRWRCARKREFLSESRMRKICMSGSMSGMCSRGGSAWAAFILGKVNWPWLSVRTQDVGGRFKYFLQCEQTEDQAFDLFTT